STISHDEGALRLGTVLAKKRYYGASSLRYWRKHRQAAFSQGNLLFRAAFIRNWRRLIRHPLLTAGIISLKTLEMGAIFLGATDRAVTGVNAPSAGESSQSGVKGSSQSGS